MDVAARPRAVAVALFLLAFLLYARTSAFPFVEFDDPSYVRDNPHLAGGLDVATLRWALTSTAYQYNWHPLTWLSHALDRELFGTRAGLHHLVNALLHAASAALLFLALRGLTARAAPSAFVAALFAVHPLHVESVAWIAQRKDVLAGLFFALTLLAYARHARAPSPGRWLAVAAALACGLASKPTLVTVPLLLLVLDGWPLGRLRSDLTRVVAEKLPLLALALGAAALTVTAQRAGGALDVDVPLAERAANAGIAYLVYLRQVLVPVGLAVLYPHPFLVEPEGSRVAAGAAAWLVLAVLSAGAVAVRRRMPWVLAGWLWFLGVLVPMIGFVQVGNQAHADRYAYLAAPGLYLALVFSAAELARARPRLRAPLVALGGVWLAALLVLAWRQLGTWRDSETLFRRAIAVTDANFVAHTNLGQVLGNAGEVASALAEFDAALAARNDFYPAALNRGIALERLGRPDEARVAFERAVELRPRDGLARTRLAGAWLRLGDPARADAELARALEDDPALVEHPLARRVGAEIAAALEADAGPR